MTKKPTTRPILGYEKQLISLKGEVSPENARSKGNAFAARIKERMKNKGAKFR